MSDRSKWRDIPAVRQYKQIRAVRRLRAETVLVTSTGRAALIKRRFGPLELVETSSPWQKVMRGAPDQPSEFAF